MLQRARIFIQRKIIEIGIKICLRYQHMAIITGQTLYTYYKRSPKSFRTWKNCTCEMIPHMDAYLIIKHTNPPCGLCK